MYNNYKIVCNTAAGRRRYMQYLIPQVICSDIVDRYDIWVNTTDKKDIAFFEMLAKKYDKINLVWQPDNIIDGINSINAFYKQCVEDNTIYIKLDDDIVWLAPNFFEEIVKFRINYPEYFVVSPLVINNAKTTYLFQIQGKLKLARYQRAESFSKILWRSGKFALELHHWFIDNYLKTKKWTELYCQDYPMGITRFSINSIAWFGEDMKLFGGIVTGDDEEFMSCIKPTLEGKSNCFCGSTLIAHFAFRSQRKQLDAANILEKYGEVMFEQWKEEPTIQNIHLYVEECMSKLNSISQEELNQYTFPPYKTLQKENKIKKRAMFLLSRWKEKRESFIK